MVLTRLLCLAAAASAMPLNNFNQATHYPVKRQFTFTPLPVNDPSSTASPAVQNDFVYDSANLPQVDPIVYPVSDSGDLNAAPVLVEQQSESLNNPSDNSNTIENVSTPVQTDSIQPEIAQAVREQSAEPVNIQKDSPDGTSEVVYEGSGEAVQNDAITVHSVIENAVDDSTLTVSGDVQSTEAVVETTTAKAENSTEPVLRDEPVLVQVQEQANVAPNTEPVIEASAATSETTSTAIETSSDAVEVATVYATGIPLLNENEVQPISATETVVEASSIEGSGIDAPEVPVVLVNDVPMESSISEQTEAATDAPAVVPEDQPQLDFIDTTSFGNSDAVPVDTASKTAYQYLNLTDSSAQNLVVNISLPSMTTSDLISKLQLKTSRLNYTSKLDVALQLTALAHNLMTSVDDQLGVMNL